MRLISHMDKLKKTADIPYGSQVKIQTGLDNLRFIVDFAQADLKVMRAGDKLNLREDLFSFADAIVYSPDLKPKAATAVLTCPASPEGISDKALEKAQAEFMQIFRGVTLLQTGAPGPQYVARMPDVEFYVDEDHQKQTVIRPGGEVADILLYRLIQLLEPSTNLLRRLRICPECKKIFVKVKRQKYCSQICANRAYMREYRAIKGESDSNHKQYVKRKEKQAGKSVNVTRRPRRQ
jgi:hypothetical protein